MTGMAVGRAGAWIGAGAMLAVAAVPGRLDAEPPPPRPDMRGDADARSPATPESALWISRIETQLASRLPDLEDAARRRLAAVIHEEASVAQLDPLFVLALIQVESGYDVDALSGRGARGLMQLRPATLKHEALRSRLSLADPQDPVLNVRAGVRYYGRLLRAFKDDELALMAYNAGPHRISGYLRSGEVPERFRVYPRRVRAEVRRLQRWSGGGAEPRRATAPLAHSAARQ